MNQQQLYENLGGIFIKVISLILGMERDLEEGEFGKEKGQYGKALKAILKKHICPICRTAYDSEAEALNCVVNIHGIEKLD